MKEHTCKPWETNPKSMPSASRSPSRSACSGGASFKPLGLSINTGGHAFFSIMGVSRVGLDERFGLEETRLAGGLNVFLSFKASGFSLPDCDTLCSGRTSSVSSVLRRFGLSLRCELEAGTIVGRDMARFRFKEAVLSLESSSGGVRGR